MLILALEMVDHAFLFESEALSDLIHALRPHIYIKGGDYREEPVSVADALQAVGGQSVIAPLFRSDLHTSHIVKRILSLAQST